MKTAFRLMFIVFQFIVVAPIMIAWTVVKTAIDFYKGARNGKV